jgi:peptidoglycan/LPS O-acetylase OafA/YrhL
MASYSFTLYLLHYTIFSFFSLFLGSINNFILFLIAYLFTNLISIGIALPAEMRHDKINKYLMTKLA